MIPRISPPILSAFAAALLPASAWAQATGNAQPEIVVVTGSAPLPAFGLDPDKLPGETETLSIPLLTEDRTNTVLPEVVARELPGITINDEEGSPFQPDFVYRGFEASPIGGIAEGLAVYQNGVRINEAFGDNVNWDLVPQFAVQQFTVQSDNPAFGLNALGGAVSLQMKDGFAWQGRQAELSAGSFGRVTGDGAIGEQWGDWALYLGLGGSHDDGYRTASESTLRQGYGDLGYATGHLVADLSLAGAWNEIDAPGPTPVQLLVDNPRAIFTVPQSTDNDMVLVQLRGIYQRSNSLMFSGNIYYRRFSQNLIDGNTSDVERCLNDPAQLCLEGNNLFPGDALYDTQGDAVPASVLPPGATPGEIDRTMTRTDGYGVALQASWQSAYFGVHNLLVAGVSVDAGDTNYQAAGELGDLSSTLQVLGAGLFIDQALSSSAAPPIEAPVDVDAHNLYGGVYAIDTLDLTRALSLTASARLNLAQISLDDLIGGSTTTHGFASLNPGTGLTYDFGGGLSTYAGYSQSNRAPTAGELSCASPVAPCLLDAFLVADPDLKQVVSHTFEFGVRGHTELSQGALRWNLSAYRTNVDDDILLIATNVNGFGYFQNAGETRRQGVDASLDFQTTDGWNFRAAYNWLVATFQTPLTIASNSPAANAQGNIEVVPGDQLPLNPTHRITLGAEYAQSQDWRVGADLREESGQYLAGDQSNQEPKLPAYATLDLHGSYALCAWMELFGEIDNLLDANYDSYGAFTELAHLPPNIALSNPRSVVPAPGREFFLGLRVHA